MTMYGSRGEATEKGVGYASRIGCGGPADSMQALQLAAEVQVQLFAVRRTLERLTREFGELGDEMAERTSELEGGR